MVATMAEALMAEAPIPMAEVLTVIRVVVAVVVEVEAAIAVVAAVVMAGVGVEEEVEETNLSSSSSLLVVCNRNDEKLLSGYHLCLQVCRLDRYHRMLLF
jgi:hypothetical protein